MVKEKIKVTFLYEVAKALLNGIGGCTYLLISHYYFFVVSGTDDNSSGMAAWLEVAKALLNGIGECSFLNTLICVAFDLEEQVS